MTKKLTFVYALPVFTSPKVGFQVPPPTRITLAQDSTRSKSLTSFLKVSQSCLESERSCRISDFDCEFDGCAAF